MINISRSVSETRYKVLFNSLLVESGSTARVSLKGRDFLSYQVNVVPNSQINKYLGRL